jgi:hypothetical protein
MPDHDQADEPDYGDYGVQPPRHSGYALPRESDASISDGYPPDGYVWGRPPNELGAELPRPSARPMYIDSDVKPSIIRFAVRAQTVYAIIGLALGFIALCAGIVMIFVGVTGTVELQIHMGENEFNLNTAVVGIAMAVIGAFIIFLTRPDITIGKK